MRRQIIPSRPGTHVSASPCHTQIDRLLCLSVIKLLTINLFFPPFFFHPSLPRAVLYMDDYTFINAWVVVRMSNDPCATGMRRTQITAQMPTEESFN